MGCGEKKVDWLIGKALLFSQIRMHSVAFSRSKAELHARCCQGHTKHSDISDTLDRHLLSRRHHTHISIQNEVSPCPSPVVDPLS